MSFETNDATPTIAAPGAVLTPAEAKLVYAVSLGNHKIALQCLQDKINPNLAIIDGNTLLHIATDNRDKKSVKLLLSYGAQIEVVNAVGETPLYVAVRKSDAATVELLLRAGASPHQRCTQMAETALHLAISSIAKKAAVLNKSSNWLRIIYLLMCYGANPEVTTAAGKTGWDLIDAHQQWLVAYFKEWQPIADIGFFTAANTAAVGSSSQRSVPADLHTAARTGDVRRIRQLLADGANINQRNAEYETPLFVAVKHQQKAVVDLLLQEKAQPNLPTLAGETPILIAVKQKLLKIMEALINGGADVNVPIARDGNTPLFAAIFNGHATAVELLLDAGANTDLTLRKKTPLEMAMQQQHQEIVRLLSPDEEIAIVKPPQKTRYQRQVLPQKGSYFLNTCFDLLLLPLPFQFFRAVQRGSVHLVRALIAHGVSVDSRNEQNRTALHLAAAQGQQEVVQALIDAGAKVDMLLANGETALFLAIRNQHHAIVTLLLHAGASPNIKRDFDGVTPLYLAVWRALTSTLNDIADLEYIFGDNLASVRALITFDADPNIETSRGTVQDFIRKLGLAPEMILGDLSAKPASKRHRSM